MTTDGALDDQSLLTRLSAIAQQVDGPPPLAFELGRAALSWRPVDSELAQLVADSALESAVVRSMEPATRLLSFEFDDMTIEIQVSVRRDRWSLLGQVLPEPPAPDGVVRVETNAGAEASAPLDPLGEFEIDDVPGNLIRLRIEVPGTTAVTTEWVSL